MKHHRIFNPMVAGFLIMTTIAFLSCAKDDNINDIITPENPQISNVTPAEGTIGTEITITGKYYFEGVKVFLNDKEAEIAETSGDSIIYAYVPPGVEINKGLTLKIVNTPKGDVSKLNAFMVIEPVLTYVNSATKPSGNTGSTVILEGNAFGDQRGVGKIYFSDGTPTGTIEAIIENPADWTNSFVVTTVPSGAASGPIWLETGAGKSNAMEFTVTTNAVFSPSTINWSLSAPLPVGVSGHDVVRVPVDGPNKQTRQFIYVAGGRSSDGLALDQLLVGEISEEGSFGSWVPLAALPRKSSFHKILAATPFNSKVKGSGFLYLIGGMNDLNTVVSEISVTAINADGSINNSWQSAIALPQPLYSLGAVIFRGSIYIAGGATTEATPVNTAYRAVILEDGQLAPWEQLPSLPSARAHHGFITFGGYLYCVGGETALSNADAGTLVSATNEILSSKINLRTGNIEQWLVNPSSLQKERAKHVSIVMGGSLFVSSGIYSGLSANVQGSSENVYANINADGTIGNFSGATGSNTLFSTGNNNLFNTAGVSYIDSQGVAHVMIIGGARIGSPTTKLNKVLYY
jgi:hypothetical protein